MFTLPQAVLILCLPVDILLQCQCRMINITTTNEDSESYLTLLDNIHTERPYESILIIHQTQPPTNYSLDVIYQYPRPKVILENGISFLYKKHFNKNILTVILVYAYLDTEMFAAAAESLNYIRQNRILIIADNIKPHRIHGFKLQLSSLCQQYNMTNVLLKFSNDEYSNVSRQFNVLKPFPHYHWEVHHHEDIISLDRGNFEYFPCHWHNMQNITLITMSAQTTPASLYIQDSQGQWRINGIVARLVLLFGERYNVTFIHHSTFKLGEITHFMEITKMVAKRQVDIPMALQLLDVSMWENMTDTYEVNDLILMVPRAQPLSNREIFMLLLDGCFFKCIIICFLLLSIAHTLLMYFDSGILQRLDIIVNATTFPGVLGLAFVTKCSPCMNIKIIYFLVAIVGINLSSLFAGYTKTYFTSPPYHRQIYTYEDMKQSNIKILMYSAEANVLGDMSHLQSLVTTNPNISHVLEQRNNFNTSYAYFMTTPSWVMLSRKQQYHSHKAFHAPEAMKYLSVVPYSFILPYNSPYKEPLNHLMHRIRDLGFVEAWQRSTFSDMLKLQIITLRDPNPIRGQMTLSPGDFYWVWIIWLIGLGVGTIVFVTEIVWFKYREICKIKMGL